MALLTIADVSKAIAKTLTAGTPDGDQAQFFCDVVEAFIAEQVDYIFTVTDVTERIQADYDGVITLSNRPVNSIDSVARISGAIRSGWYFDGIDEIDGLEAHEVVDVTYNAGYETSPAVLKSVAVAVVARQMVNPYGIRQQTVGAISETFAAGDGSAGTIFFTPIERSILAKYSQAMGTWRLGPRNRAWRDGGLPTL